MWNIKDMSAYNRDYSELMNEVYVVDVSNQREMFATVSELVIECDLSFSGQEALKFDEWCEAFENVEFE